MLQDSSIKNRKEFRSGQRVVEEAVQAVKETHQLHTELHATLHLHPAYADS